MRLRRAGTAGIAIGLVSVAYLLIAAGLVAVAQGDVPEIPVVIDPTVAQLAGVATLAAIVAVITNIIRATIPADVFDRWGPTLAVIVAIVLALLGVFVAEGPKTANAILQAALVGTFAGWQSQLVNTQAVRLLRGPSS